MAIIKKRSGWVLNIAGPTGWANGPEKKKSKKHKTTTAQVIAKLGFHSSMAPWLV